MRLTFIHFLVKQLDEKGVARQPTSSKNHLLTLLFISHWPLCDTDSTRWKTHSVFVHTAYIVHAGPINVKLFFSIEGQGSPFAGWLFRNSLIYKHLRTKWPCRITWRRRKIDLIAHNFAGSDGRMWKIFQHRKGSSVIAGWIHERCALLI